MTDEADDLFIDWSGLGVDEGGQPIHVPTVEGDLIVCRCHRANCQLDRALFRARVSGFIQALQMRAIADALNELEA